MRITNHKPHGSDPGRRTANRRGVSLLVVMATLSMTLVLTLAFVRTQTTVLGIRENGERRLWALEAARTGAAVALERLQNPAWSGVEETLQREIHAGDQGIAFYRVQFVPFTGAEDAPASAETALHLLVNSTGVWESRRNADVRVERRVEVHVKLAPRLPGRRVYSGDTQEANDLAPNPDDYDAIQRYALFADRGYHSLVLDPGDRIDGDVWLEHSLRLYHDPHWSSFRPDNVRGEMLASIGNRFVTETDGQAALRHPHPLAGRITFYHRPRPDIQADLNRLNVPWTGTERVPERPRVRFSTWPVYRVYERGFEYRAERVPSVLEDVTLRPGPENPLGIFYNERNIRLEDDVTVQGTLVSGGDVAIEGNGIHISSFNWRGDAGSPLVSDVGLWPRLPALVADRVDTRRSIRAIIEGAIAVRQSLQGAGGDFEYRNADPVTLSGQATASPLRQPYSRVRLDGSPDLSRLRGRERYAVWLADGPTGNWYPIVEVDRRRRELTVRGEVERSAARYRIRRNRRRYLDIRGPVSGGTHDINRPGAWVEPDHSEWEALRDRWDETSRRRETNGREPIAFVDWLADPQNFDDWSYPLSEYGLPLEPTFHLRRRQGVHYRWSPPLFRPCDGSDDLEDHAGYRWQVVTWREIR